MINSSFFLGLASGLAILTLTAYRRLSPRWLKWMLIASGLLLVSRYAMLAHFAVEELSSRWWPLVSSVSLTLPGVFAVDQLVRHPAMTPKKLLRWYSPWVIAYGIMTFTPWWRWAVPALTGLFTLVFLWICGILLRKLPDHRIRWALLGLSLAYLSFGIATLLLVFDRWSLQTSLYSEMLTLLALWYAYDTSTGT